MDFDNDTKTITAGLSTDPLRIGGTAGLVIPIGTTAERPTGENGIIRYNSDNATFEFSLDATTWVPVGDNTAATVNGTWKFDTSTTNSDPGNKNFRLNNATLASVTAIYISETSNTGVDASTAFSFLSTGDKIYIQQKNDSTKAAIFSVSGAITDNGTWVTIPVTVSKNSTLYSNNAECGVTILFGAVGSSGTVTSVSVTTANGVSGTVANATTTPDITLTLGDITPTGIVITGTASGDEIWLDRYSNDANAAGYLSRKARGTLGTPTAVLSGDTIGLLGGRGYGATGFSANDKGTVAIVASENWSDTAQGTYISLNATTATTTTRTEVMKVDNTGLTLNGKKLILAGPLTTSGAFATTITTTGTTSVTLPITGTLYGTRTGSITSAQLAASMTNETGTGSLVFATSPTLVTPILGTPTSGVLTNCTGTAAGLTAGNVTTNANLTGPITSIGNATSVTANAITNAMLAQVATQTFKGRTTAATGDVEDLTATQATALLNTMVGDSGSGGTKGLVPAPAIGDASKVLSGAGTWIAAGGSGTVTSVSVTTANGVSGTVATATTTPAISLTLGNITPTTVITGNTGTESAGHSIGGVVYNPILEASDIDNTTGATVLIHKHSTTLGPLIGGLRSNSDTSSHVAVTNGMPLLTLYAAGTVVNANADYKVFGNFNLGVDDTGTISATSAPGKFELNLCPNGSTTTNQAFKVNGAGNATILNTLTVGSNPLNLTGFLGQFTGSANSYVQVNAQNRSTGTVASTDVVLTTNTGSDTAEYIDLGINGSGWTGSSYGAAKDGYLYIEGGASGVGNLVIGTSQANTKVKFSVGASGANASDGILELNNTKATITGNLGISNGVNYAVTSTATAAGTTTLTVSSTYYQLFTGSTTQTLVLPDATTLSVGHSYFIENHSTGIITINKNGGTNQFYLSPNTSCILYCTNISTAAGIWSSNQLGLWSTNYITTTDYNVTNTAYTSINAAVRLTLSAAGTYLVMCVAQLTNDDSNVDAWLGLHGGTAGSTTLITGAESAVRPRQAATFYPTYVYEIPVTVFGVVTLTAGQIVEPKLKSASGGIDCLNCSITAVRLA